MEVYRTARRNHGWKPAPLAPVIGLNPVSQKSIDLVTYVPRYVHHGHATPCSWSKMELDNNYFSFLVTSAGCLHAMEAVKLFSPPWQARSQPFTYNVRGVAACVLLYLPALFPILTLLSPATNAKTHNSRYSGPVIYLKRSGERDILFGDFARAGNPNSTYHRATTIQHGVLRNRQQQSRPRAGEDAAEPRQ